MTTRKLAAKQEENQSKRQRISNQGDSATFFNTLNDDCLLCVASFLHISDLNNFAMINRQSRHVRKHESLDKTREATIICSRPETSAHTNLHLFNDALNKATRTLSANYTRFKILGLENISYYYGEPLEKLPKNAICHLELGLNKDQSDSDGLARLGLREEPNWHALGLLLRHFPNITSLVLKDPRYGPTFHQASVSKAVTRLELPPGGVLYLTYCHRSRHITDLAADGCIFQRDFDAFGSRNVRARVNLQREVAIDFSNEDEEEEHRYLLSDFLSLQRVSLKDATWRLRHMDTDTIYEADPVSQAMLMKMARRLPNLRWLRSDLTQENIAILQRERPEVTFVND